MRIAIVDDSKKDAGQLEVAREIRSRDEGVGIVFVTSMAQYAIHGYEVSAIDFIVKPAGYYNFSVKLEKALQFCNSRSMRHILVNHRDGLQHFLITDILYTAIQ